MGTSALAAAITLLSVENNQFVLKKEKLLAHSRTFRDLSDDFGGQLPPEYASDMTYDEAALFAVAVDQEVDAVKSYCAGLSVRNIGRLIALADYYELTAYLAHLPTFFAQKIRTDGEHAKIMEGVLPKVPQYPIARLLIARSIMAHPHFLLRSIGANPKNRPGWFSVSANFYRPIKFLDFSVDGTKIFSLGSDSAIRVYNCALGSVEQELPRIHPEYVTEMAIAAENRVIITASGQMLRQWAIDEEGVYHNQGPLGAHSADIIGISKVPCAVNHVISVSSNGQIMLWDVAVKKNISALDIDVPLYSGPCVSPDGQIALGTYRGELIIVDSAIQKVVFDNQIYSLGIVPYCDGAGRILIATAEGALNLFDRAKNSMRTGTKVTPPFIVLPQRQTVSFIHSEQGGQHLPL
jgi:hypothetical protein